MWGKCFEHLLFFTLFSYVELVYELTHCGSQWKPIVQNSDLLRLNKYYDMEILYTYFSCEKFETFLFIFLHAAWLSPNGPGNWGRLWNYWWSFPVKSIPQKILQGTDGATKTEEFSEMFQTAFDFRKIIMYFFFLFHAQKTLLKRPKYAI